MKFSIGVLITYHNEKEMLRECLNSLLTYPEKPDEIFIYDDASDTPAEGYLPIGFPIKVIRGDVNRGPSYGRNLLLKVSQSDYIHFHDADDLFHPDWCRRVREVIAQTGTDVVFTEISSYRNSMLVQEHVLGLEKLIHGEDLIRFCIQGVVLVPSGTYRRTLVSLIDGYRESLWQSEDFDFHIRLALQHPHFEVITDPLVIIRLHGSNRSRNRIETSLSAIQAIKLLVNKLPLAYHRDLAEKAVWAGAVLYQNGAYLEAKRAFQLAKKIGPPSYKAQQRVYRILARIFGPYTAECVSKLYRTTIPKKVRQYLATRGR